MSTIIIITPPPTKPQTSADDVDGFAQHRPIASPFAEVRAALDAAEAEGATVRMIEA